MKSLSWFSRAKCHHLRGAKLPLRLERLEDRVQPAALIPPPSGVRSFDGTGNNTLHPSWGSAGVDLIRVAPAAYADGASAPAGQNRPSARVISNAVADQGGADIV